MRLTTAHSSIFGGLLGYASSMSGYNATTWQFYAIIIIGATIWFGIGKLNKKLKC